MSEFIRSLFNVIFSKYNAFKLSVFSSLKSALIISLLPFVYVSLFIPMITSLEALIFGINYFFVDGVFILFLNMFWSSHVSICISIIYSFKLTAYFHDLYSSMRKFQFQTIRGTR